MRGRWFAGLAGIFVLLTICAWGAETGLAVTNLPCEYKINPIGIDVAEPRMSWELVSGRGQQLRQHMRQKGGAPFSFP